MRYLLSIHPDPAPRSAEDNAEVLAEYQAYDRELRASGAFVAGDALQDAETASTVRLRDGETVVTDGPFVETKEQVGGFYVVECATREEALAWAAKIPTATRGGTIEVRPAWDYEAMGYPDPMKPAVATAAAS